MPGGKLRHHSRNRTSSTDPPAKSHCGRRIDFRRTNRQSPHRKSPRIPGHRLRPFQLPIIKTPPAPPSPPTVPPAAQARKEAVPPRKPEKLAAAKVEKPARPPARKPEVIPANLPAARSGGSIQQAIAVGPAERLPSDPSIVPIEARMGMQPDLSQMQFKIQEIHFNPGSANLTPGGERKTLTASRFITDLQVRSVRVVGYADSVGPTAFNQELALAGRVRSPTCSAARAFRQTDRDGRHGRSQDADADDRRSVGTAEPVCRHPGFGERSPLTLPLLPGGVKPPAADGGATGRCADPDAVACGPCCWAATIGTAGTLSLSLALADVHRHTVVAHEFLDGLGRAPVGHGGAIPVLGVLQMSLRGDFVARSLGVLSKVQIASVLGHGVPADLFGSAAVQTGGAGLAAIGGAIMSWRRHFCVLCWIRPAMVAH